MKKALLPKPTESELEILQVLWRRGPSTVRAVWEAMEPSRTGYTTTLKLMQIMNAKGLVARDEGQRSHIYRARFTEDQVQRHVVGQLLERLFDGSAPKLVMQALAATRATPAELAEIRDLVQRMEGGKK